MITLRYFVYILLNITVLLRAATINIPSNAKWKQTGATIAGGNGGGNKLNQFHEPWSLCVDDDQTIYVADSENHRIMEWKNGAVSGKVVAGGNGAGAANNQLNAPVDVIVDKKRDSLIICDNSNRRVVRWSRRNNTTSGETIIPNLECTGLAMDENGFLYVGDYEKDDVRRYKIDDGDTKGTVVAGGNGRGKLLNQFNGPTYMFVDRNQTVYVSDTINSRVMKWEKGAKEGIVAAGSLEWELVEGVLIEPTSPGGVAVDQLGTIYVVDSSNHRILRWPKGSTKGIVIAGGNKKGDKPNQLSSPLGMVLDRQGNLYVADLGNRRVQKFNIE